MSEKSPVSNEHVLVPRKPRPGEDPSSRKVEVWHLKGKNPDGTIRADSQDAPIEVQIVDPHKKLRRGEMNEVEKLVPSKDLPTSITGPEGQFALARELAEKPLRGDTIVANVGGKFTELTLGDYADTEKGAPRVVEALDAEGNVHHQEEGVILPETQAYMRQLKEQQDRRGVETDLVSPEELSPDEIKEVGEATLDAAEVEEPIDASRTESAAALQSVVDRVETEASPQAMGDKEYLKKMVEGLAPDDEHHLQMYALAEADKSAAQKSGDGQGSRDAQESMGWHLQRMSAPAKEIRNRYSNRYRSTNGM